MDEAVFDDRVGPFISGLGFAEPRIAVVTMTLPAVDLTTTAGRFVSEQPGNISGEPVV